MAIPLTILKCYYQGSWEETYGGKLYWVQWCSIFFSIIIQAKVWKLSRYEETHERDNTGAERKKLSKSLLLFWVFSFFSVTPAGVKHEHVPLKCDCPQRNTSTAHQKHTHTPRHQTTVRSTDRKLQHHVFPLPQSLVPELDHPLRDTVSTNSLNEMVHSNLSLSESDLNSNGTVWHTFLHTCHTGGFLYKCPVCCASRLCFRTNFILPLGHMSANISSHSTSVQWFTYMPVNPTDTENLRSLSSWSLLNNIINVLQLNSDKAEILGIGPQQRAKQILPSTGSLENKIKPVAKCLYWQPHTMQMGQLCVFNHLRKT